ncbi:MAG: immunoglobulin domain-containing protein, partial [Chitinophagales bacterium]|nr:immunoglobulin domain-containing protein [Chitinophagales bacterium]
MVTFRLKNKPTAFRNAMMAFLMLLSLSSQAQTSLHNESVNGDLPNTGNGTTLTITAAGTYTVSGTVTSGSDAQDRHTLVINSGLQLTSATYAIGPGGGGGPIGGQINWGGLANPTWGGGSSGNIGLSLPLSAGTYSQIMVAVDFSIGTTWTITYAATATAAAPTITSNPSSASVCSGGNTSFTVAANNTPTSYQWQVNTGSGYSNISNGGVYSGATSATLSITGATAGMNGYLYRATATNGTGTSSPSSGATLTVNSAPSITTNPNNASACAGGNTSFTAAASGSPTSYQWQVDNGSGFTNLTNGGVYSNVTTATLNITGVTAGMAGYLYRATATNSCGTSAASTAATLSIGAVPAISTDPTNKTVCVGSNTTFTVAASNTPTSYQWQVNTGSGFTNISNGGVYSNATTATVNITGATAGMDGYLYRATATNACGTSSASASATLTTVALPTITGTTPGVACVGGSGAVGATVSSGGIIKWYDAASAGNYLGSGTTLTINPVSSAGTYYAEPVVFIGGNSVSTPYNANNGNAGAMFDVLVSNNIVLNDFKCNLTGTGTYEVYYKLGTYVGSETNSAAWTLLATSSSVVSLGTGVATPLGLNLSFPLSAGQVYAFYITDKMSTGSVRYTNVGASGVSIGSNSDLTVYSGVGKGYPFAGTNSFRSINCTIDYSTTSCTGLSRSAVALSLYTSPSVSSHPSNSSVSVGANTSFSVTGTATGIAYQWQENTGSGWANITNGGIYSNATTATLNLTAVTLAMNSYQYRCVISGTCTPVANSNPATLTVLSTPPVISTDPVNAAICNGANTSFTTAATNTPTSYTWQVNSGSGYTDISNGGVYSNATTATLNITGATTGMNGYLYRVIATNPSGSSAPSAAATLTVNTPPAIGTSPSNSTICSSTNTSFSVVATGAGLGYQWQVDNGGGYSNISNGGVYSNATAATLNITSATNAMNGYQYRCVVTGTCTPAATSAGATLTVVAAPVVNTQPLNQVVCNNAPNVSFTTAVSNATGYQWFVNTGSGFTAITNNAVYSGATTNTLTITSPSSSMNGYLYKCAASANTPCSTVETNTVTLTVVPLAVINTQPSSTPTCVGSNATFSVTASNANGYQWQENTGSGYVNISNVGVYSGATTSTLTITGATIGMGGYQYRCVVLSNTPCGSVTSSAATLTVNTLPSIVTQPDNSSMTVCALAGTASCSTVATGTGVSFQWQENTGSGWNNLGLNPVITNNGFGGLTFTNPPASMNGYQYRCLVSGTCTPSLTSNVVTLTVNTSPVINTQASGVTVCAGDNPSFTIGASGTALTYQWQVDAGSGFANITNGGVYSNATAATLNITAAPYSLNGYQYRCVVSGTCSPSVTGTPVTLVVNSPAIVTAQPLPQTVCDGGNATFTTTAIGTNLTYQWYANYGSGFVVLTNSSQYSGVTTNTLTVTSANPGINGSVYECRITTGTSCLPTVVATGTASLTVYSLPIIYNAPVASTICDGGNTAFGVTATGTGLTYQWQVNTGSGFANITNGGVYSNATTATLNLTAATAAMTGYSYRCVVSGTCTPSVTSSAATLTVRTLPAIATHPSNVTLCAGATATFSVAATGAGLTYQWQENTGSGFV